MSPTPPLPPAAPPVELTPEVLAQISEQVISVRKLQPGSMGLTGTWQLLGNTSAMVVVCGICLTLLGWLNQQAKEDRALCREQVMSIRHLTVEIRDELRVIHERLDRK